MPTESRTERLLNAYINGDDISNFVPLSRNEQILKDMILGNEQTSSPQSRIESLYQKLDEKIKEGSGGENNPLQHIIDNLGGDGKPSCYYLIYNYKGTNLDVLSQCDFSKVSNMGSMFYQCLNLTTIPLINTSACTTMSFMFTGCHDLISVPLLNTSNVINMHGMFQGCQRLTSLPLFDTSKVTDMGGMFYLCRELKTIPQLDTSNVTDMLNMFQMCDALMSVPELNTSNVTNMSGIFDSCPNLKTVAQLDLIKSTNNSSMFYNCRNLTYIKLLNIKTSLSIGSGTSWGHLIEKDCLIQIISELIKPSSGTKTLTMGTTNKAKIADTYVKLLEDDRTGKYPFEVCASTDEGAMTIESYCTAKNWQLA